MGIDCCIVWEGYSTDQLVKSKWVYLRKLLKDVLKKKSASKGRRRVPAALTASCGAEMSCAGYF